MKRDPLAVILITVLFVSTLATAGMCYWYLYSARTHRALASSVNFMNQNRQLIQPLAVDLNTYARQNPAIVPLLEQMNLRIRTLTNPTNAARTQPQP